MLVLFETAAGYGIFKLLKEKKLQQTDNLYMDFESPEAASKIVKLKHFQKFQDTTEALASVTAAVEGKMSKTLKKMLKKLVVGEMQETLAVADAKLGNTIKDKLDLQCVSNSAVQELMRCIRSQADSLITGLPQKDLTAMSLGLAHSLSRYKLKFSPDKVDTMIVQAISLLDDLDKELNNYSMRAREWYGWHFPELGKIITDNIVFARVVMAMGERTNAASCDLSSVLPEDLEQEVKEAAEISMGTEVSEGDILNISHLCEQVVEISDYRATLYDYLKNRMVAIAPNLTLLVGELVGARLIAHSGSLMNLAKHPSSTVQVLGAEKALFRALKSKNDTPKYGLIYHASLVSQTNAKMKGKVSRTLAAKCSLGARIDALGEGDADTHFGVEHRAKLEARIRALEEGTLRRISGSAKQKAKWDKYENKSEVKSYDPSFDSTLSSSKKRKISESAADTSQTETPGKKKKKMKTEVKTEPEEEIKVEETEEPPKKKKKKKKSESDVTLDSTVDTSQVEETETPKKKKKKKSGAADVTMDTTLDTTQETPGPSSEKKKKKKKKSKDE